MILVAVLVCLLLRRAFTMTKVFSRELCVGFVEFVMFLVMIHFLLVNGLPIMSIASIRERWLAWINWLTSGVHAQAGESMFSRIFNHYGNPNG